ncbi:colicin immunity domain-containing protein [Saccharopolyspora sp. NPDC003752]
MSNDVADYVGLIRAFTSGKISAPRFEEQYMAMFKAATRHFPEPVYEILNDLFLDCDEYVADPDLRDEDDLDDQQLHERATEALTKLETGRTTN